ncbi:MAG: hypothetical protein AAGF95_20215 [Chloroflexota bacterium]
MLPCSPLSRSLLHHAITAPLPKPVEGNPSADLSLSFVPLWYTIWFGFSTRVGRHPRAPRPRRCTLGTRKGFWWQGSSMGHTTSSQAISVWDNLPPHESANL